LLSSVSAFAQVTDTTIKRKPIRIPLPYSEIASPQKFDKALIVIDGAIYQGSINSIDGSYVTGTRYLDSVAAVKIYGKQGANGAIILTTRYAGKIRCLPSLKTSDPLYVLDGIVYKGDINKINPESILNIVILKDDKAKALYSSAGLNGVIIITTKPFAILQYQKKFSSFSGTYKKYLAAHNNDDSRVTYVLDGEVVKPGNKFIDTLFNLPLSKIQHVNMLGPKEFEGMTTHMVIITTKK